MAESRTDRSSTATAGAGSTWPGVVVPLSGPLAIVAMLARAGMVAMAGLAWTVPAGAVLAWGARHSHRRRSHHDGARAGGGS